MISIARMRLKEPKKHSVRYDAIDDNQALTSIYIAKTAFTPEQRRRYPLEIIITIDTEIGD